MQDINQIKEKVKEFILKTSYVPADQIQNDTMIFAQGIMDSMGFISIIGFIEESFAVSASDDDLIESNFESIDAISNFISRKLQ
jgi:acyl carrier protein